MLTRYGAGRHIQTLTLADIQPQDILAYTVRLIYQLVLSGTKLGICFFHLRVFPDRNSRYIIFGLIAFIVFLYESRYRSFWSRYFSVSLLLMHGQFSMQIVLSMSLPLSISLESSIFVVMLSCWHLLSRKFGKENVTG
jgi:hypothetical protein